MNSFTASLELWLKLQCQTQQKVTQAIFALNNNDRHQVAARWPVASPLPTHIDDTLAEVARKQRLHLVKLDDEHLLLGQPVIINGTYVGAVIMNIANGSSQDTKQILEALTRGLVWLQFLLHEHTKPTSVAATVEKRSAIGVEIAAGITAAEQHSPLVEHLLQQNSLQETAISLVNMLATQLHCVRVSLGWQTTKGIVLEAVSFSANFDKRAPAMQVIVDAMHEASDQASDIDYVDQEEPNPDAVTYIKRHHEQLVQQQSLHSAHSFLLRKEKRIIGVLTFEKAQQQLFTEEQRGFVRTELPLITHILDLKKSASAGLWQRLKQLVALQSQRWLDPQQSLAKIAGIVALVFVAMLFIPTDYHVSSDASLKSAYKHLLVSPQDGYLKTINVRPGDLVKKGDLLAQLNDDELNLQRRKLASQAQQYQQEYDTALANSNRVAAAIANTQVDQAMIQLRLVDQQLSRIRLLAPNDGVVVSDDISQTLGAPVKQGDMLFEIAAAEGYVVQLMVDERDIAELKVGQRGQVKLTSLPNDTFEFSVRTITPLSEIKEGRNYFKVEATLKDDVVHQDNLATQDQAAGKAATALKSKTAVLRPGMTGTGKINTGKHSLGWIWFHDLWHWLSLKLWW